MLSPIKLTFKMVWRGSLLRITLKNYTKESIKNYKRRITLYLRFSDILASGPTLKKVLLNPLSVWQHGIQAEGF